MIGHDAEPVEITVIRCAACSRSLDAQGRHVARSADHSAASKLARERAAKNRKATAEPYTGPERCEAEVQSPDGYYWSRCFRQAKWKRVIVSPDEQPLLVCGVHIRSSYVRRHDER